jgi:hypothetical protein
MLSSAHCLPCSYPDRSTVGHPSCQPPHAYDVTRWTPGIEGFPQGKAFCLWGCSPWKEPHLRHKALMARRAHARHTVVLLLTVHDRSALQGTPMQHRTAWKSMALACVCTLVLVPRGRAQQVPSPRPHAPGTLMVADKLGLLATFL